MNQSSPVNPSPNAPPFFIVGSGRSGSTLLRMMLSSHSLVSIPPETWFLLDIINSFPLEAPLDNQQMAAAVDIITRHYRWPDLNIDATEFAAKVARLEQATIANIALIIYQSFLERENKQMWGDKTPPYIRIVPQLATLFPGAKFIYLVRDGRDVTLSLHTQGWNGPWLYGNTREWRESQVLYNELSASKLNDSLMMVKYEALVDEPEKTLREICSFIGVAFEPGQLDWQLGVENKVPQREKHIHVKLARKPKSSDKSRWKSELSSLQILGIESAIHHQLRSAGYAPKYNNPLWLPAFWLTRLYCSTVLPAISFCQRLYAYARKKLA